MQLTLDSVGNKNTQKTMTAVGQDHTNFMKETLKDFKRNTIHAVGEALKTDNTDNECKGQTDNETETEEYTDPNAEKLKKCNLQKNNSMLTSIHTGEKLEENVIKKNETETRSEIDVLQMEMVTTELKNNIIMEEKFEGTHNIDNDENNSQSQIQSLISDDSSLRSNLDTKISLKEEHTSNSFARLVDKNEPENQLEIKSVEKNIPVEHVSVKEYNSDEDILAEDTVQCNDKLGIQSSTSKSTDARNYVKTDIIEGHELEIQSEIESVDSNMADPDKKEVELRNVDEQDNISKSVDIFDNAENNTDDEKTSVNGSCEIEAVMQQSPKELLITDSELQSKELKVMDSNNKCENKLLSDVDKNITPVNHILSQVTKYENDKTVNSTSTYEKNEEIDTSENENDMKDTQEKIKKNVEYNDSFKKVNSVQNENNDVDKLDALISASEDTQQDSKCAKKYVTSFLNDVHNDTNSIIKLKETNVKVDPLICQSHDTQRDVMMKCFNKNVTSYLDDVLQSDTSSSIKLGVTYDIISNMEKDPDPNSNTHPSPPEVSSSENCLSATPDVNKTLNKLNSNNNNSKTESLSTKTDSIESMDIDHNCDISNDDENLIAVNGMGSRTVKNTEVTYKPDNCSEEQIMTSEKPILDEMHKDNTKHDDIKGENIEIEKKVGTKIEHSSEKMIIDDEDELNGKYEDVIPSTDFEKDLSIHENSNISFNNIDKPIETLFSVQSDKETEEAVSAILKFDEDDHEHVENTPNKQTKTNSPCRLSNNLDILTDDDEELVCDESSKNSRSNEKQFINLDEDDDIMVIDEDSDNKENTDISSKDKIDLPSSPVSNEPKNIVLDLEDQSSNKDAITTAIQDNTNTDNDKKNTSTEKQSNYEESACKPLLPNNFLTTCKKNLAEMSRTEIEEFCILKIVESVVDRSSLNELKSKLQNMSQNIEEYKKKAIALAKQNRDLQVVLKSVQEEQRKVKPGTSVTPLKITRSVGLQILMTDLSKRKPLPVNTNTKSKAPPTSQQSPRLLKQLIAPQQIPVPRLVPANNNNIAGKPLNNSQGGNQTKTSSPVPNTSKNASTPKSGEKRSRPQPHTVDLTDDEPAPKVAIRNSSAPTGSVKLVNTQNLLNPRQQLAQNSSSPRKVYIPISGPQGQNIRPGQIMLRTFPAPNTRMRGPIPPTLRPQQAVRITRVPGQRHPAPLPDALKQYQPPNWKDLPPAPDLKLSKVENGIVISWKIEGYHEDSYEEIASYQLYAYQETSAPPSTALWKKIGDVKALQLPMACTLTQFMAGYKYYFAVRAVDIRSRLGPFSLPGSILLLSKT